MPSSLATTPLPPATSPSSARPQRPSPRLAVLDGLRLCAALFVVLFHYVGMSPSHWGTPLDTTFPHLHPIAAYGWTGVQLFFLISGFVICMSSWGRRLGDFFISRVVRLYPAFWFAVIATTTVVTLTPLLPVLVERHTLSEVLVNLTMVHETFGITHVDPPYWTLWVEMRFYLLFAIVVWLGVNYQRVVTFCGLWTIGAIIASGAKEPVLEYIFMPKHAPFFIAGIAFYLIHRFGPNLLLWGIVGVSWAHGLHHVRMHMNQHSWVVVAAIITFYFTLLAAIALGLFSRPGKHVTPQVAGKKPRRGLLIIAGSLSYPLYLFHQSIGWIVIERVRL
ncbi:MAG: acyltransferase, partial [Longispora sp.]|nr:acyltransferase [Longispora sp. (in: high G+C Gram-positive bacteria)]